MASNNEYTKVAYLGAPCPELLQSHSEVAHSIPFGKNEASTFPMDSGHRLCWLSSRHRRSSWLHCGHRGGRSHQTLWTSGSQGHAPILGDSTNSLQQEYQGAGLEKRHPHPKESWGRSIRWTWHRGLEWKGLGSRCSWGKLRRITSVRWSRDYQGGSLPISPSLVQSWRCHRSKSGDNVFGKLIWRPRKWPSWRIKEEATSKQGTEFSSANQENCGAGQGSWKSLG